MLVHEERLALFSARQTKWWVGLKNNQMASIVELNNKPFILNISNLRANSWLFSRHEAGEISDICVTYRKNLHWLQQLRRGVSCQRAWTRRWWSCDGKEDVQSAGRQIDNPRRGCLWSVWRLPSGLSTRLHPANTGIKGGNELWLCFRYTLRERKDENRS